MKKKYSVQELADILGCSRVAISKKIKLVNDVTGTKLYKNRYEVVTDDGKMQILLDDVELEQEKRLSNGFKKVTSNGYDNDETQDIIDVEPILKENNTDKLFEFTERYINDYKTLQETMYNELRNRDKQILLLTTSEKDKEKDYLQAVAENKTLKTRNRIITLWLIGLVTLLIIIVTGFVTFMTVTNNVTSNSDNVTNNVKNNFETVNKKNDVTNKKTVTQPNKKVKR